MPTQAQLEAEAWWRNEFAPPALVELRSKLLAFWGLPSVAIGIKGNISHLAGYHRSYAWVKNSSWCTSRTYSTSETSGNRSPGDQNWLCAMDISLPPSRLLPTCNRLDRMIRSGGLEKVTEWYGNLDGDSRVDGYDNIRNRVASSDSSHLWHLHLSFDRGRANEDHQDLYEVLTGEDMTPEESGWLRNVYQAVFFGGTSCGTVTAPNNGRPKSNSLVNKADALLERPVSSPAPVDVAALAEALKPYIREAVREELDKTKLGSA